VRLSAQERAIWTPLPETRAAIPVLLYHGIGDRSDFDSDADALYGVTQPNFAKQMALLHAAGYDTITLEQFRAYLAGEPVALPAHPLLLTFDDSLANSFDGADAVLRQLGWTAVMFVDVGSVDEGKDHQKLRVHVPSYRPLAFAPPYGNFGQLATDDPGIPGRLGAILRQRYGTVFVQQPARYARPGETVVARLQITRKMAGGDIHAWLKQQLPA
jgi:hypothetical protein